MSKFIAPTDEDMLVNGYMITKPVTQPKPYMQGRQTPAQVKTAMGHRIAYARVQHRVSVNTIAKYVGVNPNTVYIWLSQDTVPGGGHLLLLSEVLRVSLVWLMLGREKV